VSQLWQLLAILEIGHGHSNIDRAEQIANAVSASGTHLNFDVYFGGLLLSREEETE
jgi:hypothetical protein